MKKQIIFILLQLGSILTLNAQLYSPSGSGPSKNINVGIGIDYPNAPLEIFTSSEGNETTPLMLTNYSSNLIANTSVSLRLAPSNSPTNRFSTITAINDGSNGIPLVFKTGNGSSITEKMRVSANGNIGIGTNNPFSKLSLGTGASFNTAAKRFAIEEGSDGAYFYGIGGHIENPGDGSTAGLGLWGGTDNQIPWNGSYGTKPHIFIKRNSGNVGIGTTNPQNKLDVNGTIRAKEIKVETGWADFVFHPSYQLKPLTEVEKYIKANNHLEDIPSASEIEQNGVNVGEMQKKLLQKVEELTLYTIEQNKKLEEQTRINKMLLEKIEQVEKQINK